MTKVCSKVFYGHLSEALHHAAEFVGDKPVLHVIAHYNGFQWIVVVYFSENPAGWIQLETAKLENYHS